MFGRWRTAFDRANRRQSLGITFGFSLIQKGIYYGYDGVIRPVITLSKTVLGDEDESIVDDTHNDDKDDKTIPNTSNNVSKNNDNKNNTSTNKKQSTVKVSVANTYMKVSLIIIILGFILACASVAIYYIIKKKGSNE